MRTTIDIPDHLFRRAKAAASLDGKSLKSFVTEALEAKVTASGESAPATRRTRFPLVQSKVPGSVKLDELAIAEMLEREDVRVSGGH